MQELEGDPKREIARRFDPNLEPKGAVYGVIEVTMAPSKHLVRFRLTEIQIYSHVVLPTLLSP